MKYSAEMEVFALRNLLNFLKSCDLKISVLVSDRSTTVRSMLATEYPEINHQFDIWYVCLLILVRYDCQAKPQLQVELSLKDELVLFSSNPY